MYSNEEFCSLYSQPDQIGEVEMGWVCSRRGSDKKCMRYFVSEDGKEGDHLEGLDVDGTVILKELLKALE